MPGRQRYRIKVTNVRTVLGAFDLARIIICDSFYIIEVCETTDPEIAELAETAKAGLRQSETEK